MGDLTIAIFLWAEWLRINFDELNQEAMKLQVKKNLLKLLIPIFSIGWYMGCFKLYPFIAQESALFLSSDGNEWLFASCGYGGIFRNAVNFALAFGLCLYFTMLFWWKSPKKMVLFILINTAIQTLCVLGRVLYLRYEVLERMIPPSQSPWFMNLFVPAFLGFQLAVILNLIMKKKIDGYVIPINQIS